MLTWCYLQQITYPQPEDTKESPQTRTQSDSSNAFLDDNSPSSFHPPSSLSSPGISIKGAAQANQTAPLSKNNQIPEADWHHETPCAEEGAYTRGYAVSQDVCDAYFAEKYANAFASQSPYAHGPELDHGLHPQFANQYPQAHQQDSLGYMGYNTTTTTIQDHFTTNATNANEQPISGLRGFGSKSFHPRSHVASLTNSVQQRVQHR